MKRRRPPIRSVGTADTATAPLPEHFPVRRLWTLLAVVLLLAVAALLSVYRPWTGARASDAAGDEDEIVVDG
jgi:hypothetical protein